MYRYIFLVLITLTIGCTELSQYTSDSYYLLPTNIEDIPSDDMNPITQEKADFGEILYDEKGLSMSATVACSDCHDTKNRFQTLDTTIIGGCGEGCFFKEGEYTLIEGYFGAVDSMKWVVSHAATNIAYASRAGLSSRFWGRNNGDKREYVIKHFGLEKSPEKFVDMLMKCDPSLLQCMVALGGHRQFSYDRLKKDLPNVLESLEQIFNIKIDETTPEYMVKFYIACCIDAFQRTQLTTDGRFQQYLRGEIELTDSESRGKDLAKGFCRDCHFNKVWGGGIAPSSFVNLPNVPDAVNDIMPVTDTNYVWRVVRPFLGQMMLLAPHGEYNNMEDYLHEHVPFEMDYINERQLDSLEILDLSNFIESI